jgi:hypothetical protein
MTPSPEIIILPAQNCRRSRKILAYLDNLDVRYTRVPLESEKGQQLAREYHLRASPGILVDGVSVNPFDLLIKPACRVDDSKARELFGIRK